ncbi:MAG TPA: aminotransferase class I/II-fold pyridoxal phosphate-dependent enzyme [Gaiellaceae bacterium]
MTRSPQLPRLVAELYGTTTLGDCAAAASLLIRRRELVRGPAIAEYEREFARRIDVGHAISFASGRVALYALLRALGVGSGDEVLLQLPTHVVVVNAVRYTGARPIFVDCDPSTFNIDLADADRRATPRAKVLLLQHTFGIPVDMDAAQALARRRGLIVVEDCVHALGSTYGGRPVGSLGRAAFFSTEETKTISSTMGGMAVTSDAGLAERVRAFQASCAWPPAGHVARYLLKLIVYHVCTQPRLHPYVRPLYVLLGRSDATRLAPAATGRDEQRGERPRGYDMRLGNAQAAIALRQLRRLDENVGHRRSTAAAYRERLAELGFDLPQPPPAANPAYVRYPVQVPDRAAAVRAAGSRAVLGGWFSTIIGEARSPADVGYEPGSCPHAEELAGNLVNLPTHQRVRAADVDAIVDALASVAAP